MANLVASIGSTGSRADSRPPISYPMRGKKLILHTPHTPITYLTQISKIYNDRKKGSLMELIKEVIKQDIAAAIQAFERDDFRFVNIMGNRLMSNLLLAGESNLMILGYLLKEVSKEFEEIRGRGRLAKCKEVGKKFLNDLHAMIKDETDAKEAWERYYEYENNVRKYIPDDIEVNVYKENIDFTKKSHFSAC